MRIVVDMQGAQTESRFRGIGRYTIEYTKALVRNRGDHEIILVLNGLFPVSIEQVRKLFKDLLPMENIVVWQALGPTCDSQPSNRTNRVISEIVRESFLYSLNPDIIHINSLFEGYVDSAVTSIGHVNTDIPTSIVFYDLIPFLNPEKYFKDEPNYKEHYLRKIEHLAQASYYFAISESARSEIIENLGYDQNQITNIRAAATSQFTHLKIETSEVDIIYKKYDISRKFIFYSGGSDKRKNLHRLVAAFAELPLYVRSKHQLVFGGRFPVSDIVLLKQSAQKFGLDEDELLFINHVSDNELIKLYNLCHLYVFPSLHEGFGLPVLEAMMCGAPVIGSNSSSLPEVLGADQAMFNALDISAMSKKIEQGLSDESYRNFLIKNGLEQSKKFSWDQTAKQSISVWESLNNDRRKSGMISSPDSNHDAIYLDIMDRITVYVSELDDIQLRSLSNCLAQNEQLIRAFLGQEITENEITWRIEGPFDSNYSLALLNREIARSLSKRGVNVALYSTEGPGDFEPSSSFLKSNPDLGNMNKLANSINHDESSVVSRNLYPPRVEDMNGPLNLIHSYAWEESGFPIDRVKAFNTYLDGITCISKHVKKILRDNGVRIPLSVSGAGFDHWLRVDATQKSILDVFEPKSFCFIHVSSFFPRKGPDVLLEAWARTFSATDDVCLVIKTFPNPHNQVHQQLKAIFKKYPNCGKIIVMEDELSSSDLKSLYQQCDVLVAPSFAEGFCLPIGEAILSGIPVITTNWSGQLDFCSPKNSWLVDFEFQQTNSHFGLAPSVWAKVDIDSLASAMKAAFKTNKLQRSTMAGDSREFLMNNFCWDSVADRLIDTYRDLYNHGPADDARIGVVSTFNTKCGIAQYTRHLISSFKNHPIIFAARTHEPTEANCTSCYRCWNADGNDNLEDLKASVEKLDLNTILIQWNFGFFNHIHLTQFVRQQKEANKVIVFDLHAVKDPPQNTNKKLVDYVDALSLADRIMVHSIHDMNRLKGFGLVENVVLFPLGVVENRLKSNSTSRIPTIATYGFCLPHKGLAPVIDAVQLLKKSGDNFNLRMFNSEYPDEKSTILVKDLQRKIEILGLQDRVVLDSRFLSDEETLSLLQQADLIIFPYDPSSESASAAVRFGLAAHKPTLVTDISIFEEFGDAVWRVKNNDPELLAKTIKETMNQIQSRSEEYESKRVKAETWVSQHNFTWLSQRLEGMLRGLYLDIN